MMFETGCPIEPAVPLTWSTTRLITLLLRRDAARDVLFARDGDALRAVLARRGERRFAVARLAVARLVVRRFAAAFFPPLRAAARDGARRRLEDFFAVRERFDEDFVERFLEEDRLLDAMGFLLFLDLQSGLM